MGFIERLRGGTVGARLGIGFGLMVLLLAGSVSFSILRLGSLNAGMLSMLEHEVRATDLVSELHRLAYQSEAALGRAVMADSIDVVQASLKEAEQLRAHTDASKKDLLVALRDEGARAGLEGVTSAEAPYRAALGKVIDAIKGGDTDAARIALNDKALRTAAASYLSALDKFEEREEGSMGTAKADAASAYANGRNLLLGAVVLSVLLATGLALGITRSLTRQLGAEPASAAEVARSVAQGNLSVPISLRPGDDDSLMAHLKAMRDSLSTLVGRVRSNADSVATASTQIAQGNQELSGRTEQQASSLQETAASMEQLGSTVRCNAENARQANQLALNASSVAVQGGEVVGQVVDTMKRINESSRKIADIISVIDGIAFQTNILALNAAVEAARAGEQGRGFAVVAGEVRNLAQRSAEAAKEIKSLINASVERVEQGSALVDRAGMTMTEVVSSIRRVTDIVGEISAASVEQSAGVAQVGSAISQMDQATQQNAALVEESAASAESLRMQARQLVETVAVFVLEQGRESRPAPANAIARRHTPEAPARSIPTLTQSRAAPAPASPLQARAPSGSAPAPAKAAAAPSSIEEWETF